MEKLVAIIVLVGFCSLATGIVITICRLADPTQVGRGGMLCGGMCHAIVAMCALALLGFPEATRGIVATVGIVEIVLAVAFFVGFGNECQKEQSPHTP